VELEFVPGNRRWEFLGRCLPRAAIAVALNISNDLSGWKWLIRARHHRGRKPWDEPGFNGKEKSRHADLPMFSRVERFDSILSRLQALGRRLIDSRTNYLVLPPISSIRADLGRQSESMEQLSGTGIEIRD
jgi:hypothetical protein